MSTEVPQALFTRNDADEFDAAMRDRQRQVHFKGPVKVASTTVPRKMRAEGDVTEEVVDDSEKESEPKGGRALQIAIAAIVFALITFILVAWALYKIHLQNPGSLFRVQGGCGSAVMRT